MEKGACMESDTINDKVMSFAFSEVEGCVFTVAIISYQSGWKSHGRRCSWMRTSSVSMQLRFHKSILPCPSLDCGVSGLRLVRVSTDWYAQLKTALKSRHRSASAVMQLDRACPCVHWRAHLQRVRFP